LKTRERNVLKGSPLPVAPCLRPTRALRLPRPAPIVPALVVLGVVALGGTAAHAQAVNGPNAPETQQNPTPGHTGTEQAATGGPGFMTNLWTRGNLLGDLGGVRTALGNVGISIGLQETSEVLGNVTGGVHRGAAYDGLTEMSLGIDTDKAFGWKGGTFNVSAFQIHGRNLSADNLDNIQTASGIEAQRATRLWELWYDQAFLDGRMDFKIGQQSLDQEFMGSQGASLFMNTMMGWPVIPSFDLYAGGPAYPLSSLGVRLRGQVGNNITLLGGVFDDNPAGGPFDDDSQVRGAEQSGTKFNLNTGALFIAEIQYALNQPGTGQMQRPGESTGGLPGTYKLGGWFDTANFPDQHFDTTGLSLADPNSTGNPRYRRHNWSIYGVADQMVWRPDADSPRSVNVFTRIMGAPGDRNFISFGLNAGVTLKAPLPGRDDDTFGVGYGLAQVSGAAGELDKETAFFTGAYTPRRGSEQFIEVTYQYQAAPWWTLQPDFQYVFMPGGGIANPNNPTQRIGNEAIFGLRTNIVF
jgi:porin